MNMKDEHSIENLGSVRWHLCLCLLLAWVLVVLFVSRGIKSTGKVQTNTFNVTVTLRQIPSIFSSIKNLIVLSHRLVII